MKNATIDVLITSHDPSEDMKDDRDRTLSLTLPDADHLWEFGYDQKIPQEDMKRIESIIRQHVPRGSAIFVDEHIAVCSNVREDGPLIEAQVLVP